MLNYDWGLITDKEHDFLLYHSLTKIWHCLPAGWSGECELSVWWRECGHHIWRAVKKNPSFKRGSSWLVAWGNHVYALPRSPTGTCLYLSKELLNLWVNFNRIRRGQGTDTRDKLQLPFEDRGLRKRERPDSAFREEGWQWKVHFSLNNGELTPWSNIKK